MRAALAAALVAVGLTACGAQHSSQRPAVARYIKAVQRIETGLQAPLAAVTRAGAELARAPHRTSLLGNIERQGNEQQLGQSLVSLRAAQRRLAALPTPAAAVHLRELILRLTASELDLTGQLRKLAVFLPRFAATLAPLGPATVGLERVLAQTQAYGSAAVSSLYAAKASALRDFRGATGRIAARLRRLDPPRVSLPQYRAELGSLHGMGQAAGSLATALAGGAPGNVTPLLHAFDRAAAATRTARAQRAQIAAIRAYDASSAQLSRLSAAVAEERLRLANTLT